MYQAINIIQHNSEINTLTLKLTFSISSGQTLICSFTEIHPGRWIHRHTGSHNLPSPTTLTERGNSSNSEAITLWLFTSLIMIMIIITIYYVTSTCCQETCLQTSSTYCTMSLVLTQWLHVLPRATVAPPASELDREVGSQPTFDSIPVQLEHSMTECLPATVCYAARWMTAMTAHTAALTSSFQHLGKFFVKKPGSLGKTPMQGKS